MVSELAYYGSRSLSCGIYEYVYVPGLRVSNHGKGLLLAGFDCTIAFNKTRTYTTCYDWYIV